MNQIKEFFKTKIFPSPIFPWVLLFLVVNIMVTQYGAGNALSRFATMRAMVEHQSFTIDPYVDWTIDWSQTPDGHYYSNKAPGPMLLGFPVFFVLDTIHKISEKGFRDESGRRMQPRHLQKTYTSILMQALPFAILSIFFFQYLVSLNVSNTALHFGAVALLFGNTSTFFMNNYFGHGMAAVFVLACFFALLKQNYFYIGLSYGCLLLSDYGSALLLPFLLIAIVWIEKKNFAWIKSMVLGGIFPGLLWCWYHYSAFGGIFEIANKYNNPLFQNVASEQHNLWGIFAIPDPDALRRLLFGPIRGVVYTQPWVLFILAMMPAYFLAKKEVRKYFPHFILCAGGFISLWVMNASFGYWHGGGTPGPRYICTVFPIIAIFCVLVFDQLSGIAKGMMWLGLAVSIAFKAIAFPSTIIALHTRALWDFYLEDLANSSTRQLRFVIFILLFALSSYWVWKSTRAPFSSRGASIDK